MRFIPKRITSILTLILFASLSLCTSCNQKEKIKEVGENGIIEVDKGQSKYYVEYQKASKLLEDNKISEAIVVYKNLCDVEDYSSKTDSYLGLGSAYLIARDYQKAIESYTISLKFNNVNIDSYVGLGSAYLGLNEYRKAIDNYSHAKKINPNSSSSYWGLALCFDELGMLDSAKANAGHFIELEPNSSYKGLAQNILNK